MEVVRTNPFAETVTYKIEKNGEVVEVNSDNIEFRTKEEAKLNVLASKYNVQTAQKFFDLYESGQDVDEYSREFNIFQNYGRLAVPLDSEKLNVGYLLDNDQKIGAYEAGLTSRKSYYQEQNIISSNAKNSKYYAYTKGNFNASAIKGIQLDETQRAFYNFFREFALRTGINVELFSSKEKLGKYQGEQGSWNKNTKTIRIDINAGLKNVSDRKEIKHGMLNTFSHELTHIAELSGFYDELHEAIVSALEKRGTDFNELVKAKKDELVNSTPNAKVMSDEKLTYLADVEVIAECCETMLKNSKIFEDIAQGNPTLAQKIKDKLKNFIARLKQLLNKTSALTPEGKLLEECVTEFENIQKLWDKAVTDGIKTVNAVEAEQKNNTAQNSDVKNSIRQTQNMSYLNQLQQIENKKLNGSNSLYIGIPSADLVKVGISKNPFAMNQKDYRKSRRDSAKNKHYSSHSVPLKFFKILPQKLNSVAMLIDNGIKITAITDFEMKDTKGNKSFVVVGLWQNQEMESDKVNLVKSVYPLDDISQRIINNAEQNKLIVINKNKAKNMLATIGIQPSEVSRILNLSNNSLSQGNEDVKYQSRNTDIDENIEDLLFDEEFYKPFENEDKTVITESLSELQSKLENMNDDNSTWEEQFEIRTKIKALREGYKSPYDYFVGKQKKNILKDYEYDPEKYKEKFKKKLEKKAKEESLKNDIANTTPHKRAQYYIIQKTNPMWDDYHLGIRSPKDIKTFQEVVDEGEGFEWGDFDLDDAKKALKKGTIRVYSSYAIKNGTFVSTSYQQALQYAGMNPQNVHSRVVALDSVAWINGDEGQYAKVYKSDLDNIEYQQRYVEPASTALDERLQSDELLDAQDIIDTIKSVGGKVDEYGNAILYHGTNKKSRDSIYKSGKMIAKEDGLFFSTKPDGEIKGYGDNIVRVKIPVEYLELNDIFNGEAHFRLPLNSDYSANVSSVLFQRRTDYNFNKALSNREWSSFYSSVEKSNQRNIFRIGNHGIIIPDEKNPNDYKLVYYDGDSINPIVKAVYKLENYDYNIHSKQPEATELIIKLVRDRYNDKQARAILQDYTSLYGTLFQRYNSKSGRYIKLTRKSVSNRENDRLESDRTGVSQDVGQGVSDRIIEDDNLQFQMRPDGGFSNRMLLAETLEKAAKNQLEKNKVSVYKQAVEQIAELETRLNDVNQKIKKVSSVKAAERTREQRTELMKLNNVKKVLQDKVVRKDRQLLNLEAMDTIKNLIEAEKKKAVHEARVSREATLKEIQEKHDKAMSAEKEKNRERLAEVRKRKDKIIIAEREKRQTMVKGVRDARDKKENIRKIKKSLKDIAKLLNRSKAEKTVKQGLRDTASKMLELSDVLFDTDLSNADIVRRGVEAATPEEQKLLNEYLSLIGETDTELTESQRRKVYQLNSKLKDLFIRERERLNKATVEQSLTQLSESYKSTKNAKENYIRNAFDENIIDAIDNFKDEIGGTLVKDMTVNQTEELRKIVTMMLTSIRKANKIHAENINSDYEQTSIDVINEILNVKDTKELRNIISQKLTDFQWRNFKPVYAFRFIGSKTFEKLFWNLQKGESKWYIDIDEAKKFKDNCEKQYNYKSFDFKKKLEFEAADGSAFTLDLNQMMDIYAASRRPRALQHLIKGGFTFEKDSTDGKLKVKTGAKAYPLTVSTIQSIADSLSENEKGYAESMQKYLSEVMAKKGNEVSMALYGVELFNEDTYWSITSSDVFLQIEESETTGEFKLKKASFTKSTVRNASNPIVLKGFEENWCDHVNQMSLYHALTLPLEDLTKVFNYNTGVKSNEENSTAVTGVRSVIKGAFGNSAESYIRQFLRDINGGIREASRVGIADNLISLSKKASVFANFSVFIQQPTAILRALAYVDARYFLPEPNKLIRVQNYRKDWEQLKKYAPVAGIKEMGMFDTGTGKGVLEWLSSGQRDSVAKKTRNKIDDIGSWLPEMADKYAWIKLWHAIQRETRAKYGLKIGTEENLVKSGERFNEIVELTQVYDSVFSRSGAMRSSQTFDKIATSYMAEPTIIMNMTIDAVVQLKRNGKAGIKQFAKTFSSILISVFANTLLKSIVFAGRDDDEDETYSDKYWQAVKDDLLGWGSSLNPLNYYPIMRDIMSVFEGYTTERMDMSLVSDLVISIKRLMKEDGTTTDNITDFIGYIANLFGLPVRNVVRDIKAAFNTYDTLTTASKDPITSLEMSIPTAYQETYDKYWEDGYTADECRKKAITSVKTKISKKLKPVYLETLKNQDSKTVRNIRQYMNNSGFYKSLNDVDDILKGWRENSDEEEKRAQRAEKRK